MTLEFSPGQIFRRSREITAEVVDRFADTTTGSYWL